MLIPICPSFITDPLKQTPAEKRSKQCPPKGINSSDALRLFDGSPVFVKPINLVNA
jgi:hypothetical protein